MKSFVKNIKSNCRKIWNDYDENLMALGIIILVLSFFVYIVFFHYTDYIIKFESEGSDQNLNFFLNSKVVFILFASIILFGIGW